ncbi:MAG: aminomethyltransferase [Mesorhizobium amorphae]|nr:MAG: aminomethyltransferase [Mesorhizobium amorphae]
MTIQPYPPITAGPPRPSTILQPGLVLLPPGTERHTVQGRGALLIEVEAGDRITVRNAEGGQPCEILAWDASGQPDAGVLGTRSNSDGSGLKALLAEGDESLTALRRGLARRGVEMGRASAVRFFSSDTPAGTEESFTAARDGALVIAAPADAMSIEAHDTATPLTVLVKRSRIRTKGRSRLADPLADPVSDLRVHSATAESYFVKAGDYIQIIDVDGRQCTDFQCFSARKIDRGRDLPLDVTTTRTLMGSSYPMPGLHSKYYDQDMDPLVEVVQDTCGRHDAFALACAAKYYDDIGYPGHRNCSENFNRALADRGVNPRTGWMAVNLFFNTAIDAHGLMVSDEPWSRPGDYVLMRALTDLVCVSSACPDDTTAANGWDLSDIHVRTYSGQEKFSRAVARRVTPDGEAKMSRESAFQTSFAKHTRDFVEYRGFWLPNSFSKDGHLAEWRACREDAVVMDLSALRKFEVTGPDAEALLQYTLTRDVKKLDVGQVVYSAMCYEHGGMIDDGTLLRLGRDNFRWIGGEDWGGEHLRETAEKLGLKVLVRSSTDQMHNIAVQGPKSRDILREIVWTSPVQPSMDELQWFRFAVARIGGANGIPIVVSRTGYTGELGYEIWCHPRDAKQVFEAVWEAGQPHGLKPMGLKALDTVRIEAGLVFAGYDFSDETDPFEAGIGFTVPLKSKTDDFIGREALIRRKEHPTHKLVGLTLDANVPVGHGDGVYVGRAKVGVVTSGTRSPHLGREIALARLDVAHAGLGTEVEVGKLDGQQKRLPATVVAFPHYDPQKTRPRS